MNAALTQDRNRSAAKKSGDGAASSEVAWATESDALARLCGASLTGETAALSGWQAACAQSVATLAVRARMTSPCVRGFARAGLAPPPPVAEAAKTARVRSAIGNGRVMALARLAFPVLARAGIPAIAFKGPFQHRLLHGDPFFCRSGDLDLLVARADFEAALAALEHQSFRQRAETSPWWTSALGEVHLDHAGGGVIDLHHRLQQPGCPPPYDIEAFLRDPRRELVGQVEVAVPDRPQAVLICALNFTKELVHHHPSARYAYDLAAGLLGMSAEEHRQFAQFACRQRLSGTVGLAAALCERIFGVKLPLAPPLAHRVLPEWAHRSALLAMVFDPDAPATPWPRRRAILWAMCSGAPGAQRAAEFSREAARMIASEALRRTVPAEG
jgi:hypothetical protein